MASRLPVRGILARAGPRCQDANGCILDAVARLVSLPEKSKVTVREALMAWRAAGPPDPGFAADLEIVGDADGHLIPANDLAAGARPPRACRAAGPRGDVA